MSTGVDIHLQTSRYAAQKQLKGINDGGHNFGQAIFASADVLYVPTSAPTFLLGGGTDFHQ